MAQHPPEAGTPVTRECPRCGTVAGFLVDQTALAPAAPGAVWQPRSPFQYAAARAATDGDVIELVAAAVQPNMTVWHINDWRVVTQVVIEGAAVELHMVAPDGTAVRHTSIDTPVYRLP